METGTTADLQLTDVGFGGDAVGHLADGRAVFVPFGVGGERVRVRLTAAHPRYVRAELLEVLEASPRRVAAPCPHFGRCGGCAYQHLDYALEVEYKQHQLLEVLRRVGALAALPPLETAFAAPQPYGYRNKLRAEALSLDPGRATARVAYGYCQRDNRTFFELDRCPLAPVALNDLLGKAPQTQEGRRNATRAKPYPLTLRQTAAGSTAFYFGHAPTRVPWLHERLMDREVSVPLGSFWQVNPAVAEALVARVAAWFGESPTRTLVDAYSGVGTFSLALGAAAAARFLIESDGAALEAAEYNHAQWGLRCHARRGQTEDLLGRLLADGNLKKTTVLLDPPRQGCGEGVLKALEAFPVHQVIYVSCNPATLARDLRRLVGQGGYELRRLALFDMFPRTAHFETAAWLGRAEPSRGPA